MGKAKERGEYRPIYARLLNGPDFQELSGYARAIFYPLKLRLGVAGIAVVPALVATLVEDAAFPEEAIRRGLAELEEERLDGPWIRRQGNVVWLVRGLEFEPTMNVNDPQHRKHIRRVIDALPSVPLVDHFKSHYTNWFNDTPLAEHEVAGGPLEGSDGTPNGSHVDAERSPVGTSPSTSPSPTTTPPEGAAKPRRRRVAPPAGPPGFRAGPYIDAFREIRKGEPPAGVIAATCAKVETAGITAAETMRRWRRYLTERPHAPPAYFAQEHGQYAGPAPPARASPGRGTPAAQTDDIRDEPELTWIDG